MTQLSKSNFHMMLVRYLLVLPYFIENVYLNLDERYIIVLEV